MGTRIHHFQGWNPRVHNPSIPKSPFPEGSTLQHGHTGAQACRTTGFLGGGIRPRAHLRVLCRIDVPIADINTTDLPMHSNSCPMAFSGPRVNVLVPSNALCGLACQLFYLTCPDLLATLDITSPGPLPCSPATNPSLYLH